MNSNITPQSNTISVIELFQILSAAPRVEILLAIGEGEACVCHLEAALGYRQAYISQHLMALREANILESRREGRFVYYSLTDRRVLEALVQAGNILGETLAIQPSNDSRCECPNCATQSMSVQESSSNINPSTRSEP